MELGRYKAEAVIMRDMERLIILFKDEETIWAFPKNGDNHIIFHRWFESRWTYGRWGTFREILLRRRDLSVSDALELAKEYDITICATKRLPDIKGRQLKIKYERRKRWERAQEFATKTA